jgi:hypothetical protein
VLVVEVLVGFAYRAVFHPGFEKLPPLLVTVHTTALGLLCLVLALLILPGPYHQIAERGEDTARLREAVTLIAGLALGPFALALGAGMFAALGSFVPLPAAAATALIVIGVALTCWYGIEMYMRRRLPAEEKLMKAKPDPEPGPTKIEDKISQMLTETRVVLPGAQALLGFQFITVFSDAFAKLPEYSKLVHMGSLLAIALSCIWLMTPAAYHRLVEDGEATERFQHFGSRMLLLSLPPLALGLSGDFFVVLEKVTSSKPLAGGLAALLLVIFLGCWFGLTYGLRLRYARPLLSVVSA